MLRFNICYRLFKYNHNNSRKCVQRNLSYVERAKYLQELKEDHNLCHSKLKDGHFLVYNGSKPLVKYDFNKKIDNNGGPIWLKYSEVKEALLDPVASCVLLDVDKDGALQFGVQIKPASDSVKDVIEETSGGHYLDLRIALFFMNRKEAHLVSRANSLLRWNSINIFCGKCSTKTAKTIVGNSRRCSSCGHVTYPTSNPVGIVLVTDPLFEYGLLVRHPRSVKAMYSCVAGFSDVGECLEHTVKREVAEEVGIEVSRVHYIASQHWPFPSSLMMGCYAIAEKTPPQIDVNELVDAKWFNREEISAAVERIDKDPMKVMDRDNKDLIIPPSGAIAYQLIYHWLQKTPLEEIQKNIYSL